MQDAGYKMNKWDKIVHHVSWILHHFIEGHMATKSMMEKLRSKPKF